MMNWVEERMAMPLRMSDWANIDEAQKVTCGCCGWCAALGESASSAVDGTRLYACVQCSLVLVARIAPKVFTLRAAPAVTRNPGGQRVAHL